MNLVEMLKKDKEEILAYANDNLTRSHLLHYEQAGTEEIRERLEKLYQLVTEGVCSRALKPIRDYVSQMAQERFVAGYDLCEVQVAFNILEEAIWKQVIKKLPTADLAEALGLVSTIHGAAKDTLAATYVSLASHTKTSSINLMALFEGKVAF